MITDKVFRVTELLHPVRFILWLCALFLEAADVRIWSTETGSDEHTGVVCYMRIFRVKVPLYTCVRYHLNRHEKERT